ncbi:MAG: hypothetical protein ACFFB5_20775 [Promethearchaeota archaeon]
MPDEYLLKICLIGTPNELKTKMNRRFCGYQTGDHTRLVLGVGILTTQIQVTGNNIKLILVDTSGKEFFGEIRTSYYRGASAAIITFAKEDRTSFKAVKDWYKAFKRHIPESLVPIALVGFITESETVTTAEGQNLADELRVLYYESKPTDKKTVETIYHDLIIEVLRVKSEFS